MASRSIEASTSRKTLAQASSSGSPSGISAQLNSFSFDLRRVSFEYKFMSIFDIHPKKADCSK